MSKEIIKKRIKEIKESPDKYVNVDDTFFNLPIPKEVWIKALEKQLESLK